jgi:hypothetical protein
VIVALVQEVIVVTPFPHQQATMAKSKSTIDLKLPLASAAIAAPENMALRLRDQCPKLSIVPLNVQPVD